MHLNRKSLNILLIAVNLILGVMVANVQLRRSRGASTLDAVSLLDTPQTGVDTLRDTLPAISANEREQSLSPEQPEQTSTPTVATRSARFEDVNISTLTAPGHPMRAEATKVLKGNLAETDSLSRRRILSYCEHLRSAYPTRDIDFIRQVFSNDALIIVGHVVKTANSTAVGTPSEKVKYSVRSKQQYVSQLQKIFDSGKSIDVKFSDFKIMRHPTMDGIYGVTLRQKYSCGSYSDDGYLFLMWDFRNKSMPLIHVRTWQPTESMANLEDDLIGIGDFNLD